MSKNRFSKGDEVIEVGSSGYHESIYSVLFTVKIDGKRYCGLSGPERYSDGPESFLSSLSRDYLMNCLILSEDRLNAYRKPVYVTMTETQYDGLRSLGVTQIDPDFDLRGTSVDIRSEEGTNE